MWQFSEVVDGMSEACRALGIPVVGGNVSFYNESRGRDIDPTPVVGVVGLHRRARRRRRRRRRCATGDAIVLLGPETAAELGGSEWAAAVHGLDGGLPPAADLDRRGAAHDLVARARRRPGRRRRARLLRRRARGRARRDGDRRRRPGSRSAPETGIAAAAWCFAESRRASCCRSTRPRSTSVLDRAGDAGVRAVPSASRGGDRLVIAAVRSTSRSPTPPPPGATRSPTSSPPTSASDPTQVVVGSRYESSCAVDARASRSWSGRGDRARSVPRNDGSATPERAVHTSAGASTCTSTKPGTAVRSASRSARRGVSTVTIVVTPFSVSRRASQASESSPPSARAVREMGREGVGVEQGARPPLGPQRLGDRETDRLLPGAASPGEPHARGAHPGEMLRTGLRMGYGWA